MKFKSPDGRVFDHILKAKHYFCHKDPCGTQFYCAECPIYIQSGEFPCEPWVNQHSAEAARLMGYEIIEDDQPEINQEAKSDGGKPRPVSREQVEKVWRGKWKCHSDCGVTECSACGWNIEEYVGDYNFCPVCGAAQTDKAVEMVMERLEALKDG